MKNLKRKKIAVYCLLMLGVLLTFNIPVLYCEDSGKKLLEKFKTYTPDIPLIPADVTLSDKFAKLEKKKVGKINQVEGTAYVMHFGQKIAYRLKDNIPLFGKDTLVTFPGSRLNAVMNDKSVLALAPQAKLTIEKSEYSWFGNKRSTVMNLVWGRARFIVKKLSGKPGFTVKTKTAVCGTRATDFAVSVAPADKGKKVSALDRFLAYLSFIKKAHALAPDQTITAVLTGPKSTVGLTGDVGDTSIVGPASVAGAVGGEAASEASFVGESAAVDVLGSVGPDLDTMAPSTSTSPGSMSGEAEGGGGGDGGGGGGH